MEVKEEYLQAVWKCLNGPRKDRKAFSLELCTNVESYLSEKPDAGYDDLVSSFGKPEDLGKEFSDSLEPQTLERFLRIRKWIRIFVCVITGAILIFVIAYKVMDYIKMEHFRNGRWIETIYLDNQEYEHLPQHPEDIENIID